MKRAITGVILVAAAWLSLPALADRLPVPADAPPSFKAECGSCHLAFPPALLGAAQWRRIMADLDRHYGDNAALDDGTRRQIADFLARNAGAGRRSAGRGDPPRLTLSDWFRHEHDEIPAATWKDRRVGSAANCAACHSRAEAGSFREREIVMPGMEGRRRERH